MTRSVLEEPVLTWGRQQPLAWQGLGGRGPGIGPPAWRVEQYKLQSQNSPLGLPALAKELNEDKKVRKGDSAY